MKNIEFTDSLDNSPVTFRSMQLGDLDQVTELEKSIFPTPWSKESFRWEVEENRYSYPFVLVKEGQVIAFIIVWQMVNELHIANLALAPNYRRRGMASRMLETVFSWAINKGVREAHLEVRASNRSAIDLYKKFNFFEVGVRKNYYQAENEDALLMSCILVKEKHPLETE
jgi:[ribosomal protein S18]-alanine N-acetyltransferase